MDDLDYLVNEDDDLILQRFCRLSELPNSAHAKDHVNFLSGDHQVHKVLIVCQSLCDNFCSKLPIPTLEQCFNLEYRKLQHCGLHLAISH
jgi:hypothetical protein